MRNFLPLCVRYIFFINAVKEKKHFKGVGWCLGWGGINWSLWLGEIPGLPPK